MKMKNRSHDLTSAAINGMLNYLVEHKLRATYGFLAEHLGMHPHSTALWELLGEATRQDHREKRPYRAATIVNAETEAPGKLFLDTVRSFGIVINDPEQFIEEQYRLLGYTGPVPVLRPIY
jgi:hypothetical protein